MVKQQQGNGQVNAIIHVAMGIAPVRSSCFERLEAMRYV